jgi:hypothetical protein
VQKVWSRKTNEGLERRDRGYREKSNLNVYIYIISIVLHPILFVVLPLNTENEK